MQVLVRVDARKLCVDMYRDTVGIGCITTFSFVCDKICTHMHTYTHTHTHTHTHANTFVHTHETKNNIKNMKNKKLFQNLFLPFFLVLASWFCYHLQKKTTTLNDFVPTSIAKTFKCHFVQTPSCTDETIAHQPKT